MANDGQIYIFMEFFPHISHLTSHRHQLNIKVLIFHLKIWIAYIYEELILIK